MRPILGSFGGHRVRRAAAAIGCSAALAFAGSGFFAGASAVAAPSRAEGAAPPACASQPEGNARFVSYIYQEILYRCPDAGGLQYWTDQLNSGLSRMAFTLWIDNSNENLVNNNVIYDYQMAFGEVPTGSTLDNLIAEWVPKFRVQRDDADYISTLVSSDEFFSQFAEAGNQVAAWLNAAYNITLDRDADGEGMGFFLSILGENPTAAQRHYVMLHYLEESTENAHDWVQAAYYAAFNRPPDPSGGIFWTNWVIKNGRTFDMWVSLLSSNEAYTLAQSQPNVLGGGGVEARMSSGNALERARVSTLH